LPTVPTALVTGATAGLGHAFASRLAALGHDLVLVSRDAARLDATAADLRHRFGCQVEVLPADLTDRDQCGGVAARLATPDRPVELLVNSAGHAVRTPLVATPIEDEEALLDVHVRATLVLTHAAVTTMVERGSGGVINVSSVAGWLPRGSYSAHKAWVTTFSQAIARQVAPRGVRVMALAPGYMRTEFHGRAGIRTGSIPQLAWQDCGDVAADALRALEAGESVHVPGAGYRLAAAALRCVPFETMHRMQRWRQR